MSFRRAYEQPQSRQSAKKNSGITIRTSISILRVNTNSAECNGYPNQATPPYIVILQKDSLRCIYMYMNIHVCLCHYYILMYMYMYMYICLCHYYILMYMYMYICLCHYYILMYMYMYMYMYICLCHYYIHVHCICAYDHHQ